MAKGHRDLPALLNPRNRPQSPVVGGASQYLEERNVLILKD